MRVKRLLNQDVQVGLKRSPHHVDVGEVGCGDHHRVAQAAVEQCLVMLENLHTHRQDIQRRRAARRMRVGDGGDLSACERLEIFNVFAAHAAAADDAVTNGLCHGSFLFRTRTYDAYCRRRRV